MMAGRARVSFGALFPESWPAMLRWKSATAFALSGSRLIRDKDRNPFPGEWVENHKGHLKASNTDQPERRHFCTRLRFWLLQRVPAPEISRHLVSHGTGGSSALIGGSSNENVPPVFVLG